MRKEVELSECALFKAELQEVLKDPRFGRSPVLSRLLVFLVDATLRGEGKALKSYAVAVEGLDRSPDFDSNNDTYPRVQIARLRRALKAFYSSNGAERSHRLEILNGSYEVLLVPNTETAEPLPVPVDPIEPPKRRKLSLPVALSLLFGLASAAALLLGIAYGRSEANAAWAQDDFPIIAVQGVTYDRGSARQDSVEFLRQAMINKMSQFEGLRVARTAAPKADYVAMISLDRADSVLRIALLNRGQQIFVSPPTPVDGDPAAVQKLLTDLAARTAFQIAGASGLIQATEWQRDLPANSPFGCWLRFLQQLRTGPITAIDPVLEKCARGWYRAEPNNSKAAAIYVWTITGDALTAFREARRAALLEEANEIIDGAEAANPYSVVVRLADARTHSTAGDMEGCRRAALKAIELSPENLDAVAYAGTLLVMGNEPAGEAIVRGAIASHYDPPPQYFIAGFIAAMMRDDTAAAGQALVNTALTGPSPASLPLLRAAYLSRIGKMEEARAAWAEVKATRPVFKLVPAVAFKRLPLAPAVTHRLREWLAPLLAAE